MNDIGGEARVLLYVRLASALREKIRSREWGSGTCLPSIEDLCELYNVSRNTMRQALAVLRDEGLLESTRGRGTIVIGEIKDRRLNHAIVDAISNPLLENKGIGIKVLDRHFDRALPMGLVDGDGTPYERYVHIRKLQFHQGIAFGYIDIFIEADAYAKLPRNADERQLLSRLLVSDAGVEFTSWTQETTVIYPDAEIAQALDYSMTQPVVLMRRRRLDQDRKIVLAGEYRFRADQFLLRTRGEGRLAPQPSMDTVDELTKRQAPAARKRSA